MAILFCNIGWMKYYDGIAGDSIQRGGSYNKDAVGHEACNFTPCNGKYYGYVQPTGRQIAVERLGANKSSDHADGVTVVWTAGPDTGGTAIVGWYTNATVFRELQKIPNRAKNTGSTTFLNIGSLPERKTHT
jgi:5-methylcytosine-specific restriction protein A